MFKSVKGIKKSFTGKMNDAKILALAVTIFCFLCGISNAQQQHFPFKQHFLFRAEAPYDIAEINYLSGNYMQSLLHGKYNLISFTHCLPYMIYTDDNGKAILAFVEEALYTPVVRLELIKRLVKGVIQAKIPGSNYKYFFTRDSRKVLGFNILPKNKIGMFFIQDYESPVAEIGFRVQAMDGTWFSNEEMRCSKTESKTPDTHSFQMRFFPSDILTLSGAYFNPYLDMAPQINYSSSQIKELQIIIENFNFIFPRGPDWKANYNTVVPPKGKENKYLILLDDKRGREGDGWRSLKNWGNYADALLLVWSGSPAEIKIERSESGEKTEKVKIIFQGKEGFLDENIWLVPFTEVDPEDMDYIHNIASNIISTGKMGIGGFVPTRTCTMFAAPAMGLAAGAYLLKKYNDPYSSIAIKYARGTLNSYIDAEKRGLYIERISCLVRACYYLIKAGYKEYIPWMEKWSDRILSRRPEGSATVPYIYHALLDMISLGYTYEITKNPKYLDGYNEMRNAFEVGNEPGVFRWNKERFPMERLAEAPAIFLAVLGHEGSSELEKYIRLADSFLCDIGLLVGWHGGWYCTDIVFHYVGHCMKGKGIKVDKKKMLTLDEFVKYDSGKIETIDVPPLYNPNYPGKVNIESYFKKFPFRAFTSIEFRIIQHFGDWVKKESAEDTSLQILKEPIARIRNHLSRELNKEIARQVTEELESLLKEVSLTGEKIREKVKDGSIFGERTPRAGHILMRILDEIKELNTFIVERYELKSEVDLNNFNKQHEMGIGIARSLSRGIREKTKQLPPRFLNEIKNHSEIPEAHFYTFFNVYEAEDLHHAKNSGTEEKDSQAFNGLSWVVRPDEHTPGYMIHGPYERTLEPGKYLALYRIKLLKKGTVSGEKVGTIDVCVDLGENVLQSRDITTDDLEEGKYVQIPLPFEYSSGILETRLLWAGDVPISVDSITLFKLQ